MERVLATLAELNEAVRSLNESGKRNLDLAVTNAESIQKILAVAIEYSKRVEKLEADLVDVRTEAYDYQVACNDRLKNLEDNWIEDDPLD